MTTPDAEWERRGSLRLWRYCAATIEYSIQTFGKDPYVDGRTQQSAVHKARMDCLIVAKNTWVLDMTTAPLEPIAAYQDELWRELMEAAEKQALANREREVA